MLFTTGGIPSLYCINIINQLVQSCMSIYGPPLARAGDDLKIESLSNSRNMEVEWKPIARLVETMFIVFHQRPFYGT